MQRNTQNRATTWLSTCRATLLPLTTSSRTLFFLPFSYLSPPPLSVSLGPGLLFSPHIITAALALLLLMLSLIRTTQPTPHPHLCSSAELGWSRSYFTGGRSSLHLLSGDGRRGGGGGQRTGEESIWLVNFNVEADVSLCTCEISGQEMCHAMIKWGNICSLYCQGAVALTSAHVACSVDGGGFQVFLLLPLLIHTYCMFKISDFTKIVTQCNSFQIIFTPKGLWTLFAVWRDIVIKGATVTHTFCLHTIYTLSLCVCVSHKDTQL